MMKLELPRGAFGGDKWIERYYTLDTLDYLSIGSTGLPWHVHRRRGLPHPLERPVVPGVRRHRSRPEADAAAGAGFGLEHELAPACRSAAATCTNRSIARIEDVGVIDAVPRRGVLHRQPRRRARRRTSSDRVSRAAQGQARLRCLRAEAQQAILESLGSRRQLHAEPALRQLPWAGQLRRGRTHVAERHPPLRRHRTWRSTTRHSRYSAD